MENSKQYSLSELQDIQDIATTDMKWMYAALEHIRLDVIKISKRLQERGMDDGHLADLKIFLDMYYYLAIDRLEFHEFVREKLQKREEG